jgi:Tfp pilus assembly protein PilP
MKFLERSSLIVCLILPVAGGVTLSSAAQEAGLAEPVASATLPQDPEETRQEAGQESGQESGQEEAAEQDAASIDVESLPAVEIGVSDEQQQALQLVEQILAEQRLLLAGQNFIYEAQGRRDPFRSLLLLRQREIAAPELRPEGMPGFLINEIEVSAVARYQGRWQAMIVGVDGRTYFMEVGDELYDGRVVEIHDGEVVFEQEVEDLMGARSTRRVTRSMVTETQD